MHEAWLRSLVWRDLLKKEMAKKKKKEGNGNPLQPEESGRLYVVHGVTKEMDET